MNTNAANHLNPRLIQINKQAPHFEAVSYTTPEALDLGVSSSLIDLNGEWAFKFYPTPENVHSGLFSSDPLDELDTIEVPGVMELQGFGKPYYLAMSYPPQVDVKKATIPSISTSDNPTGLYLRDVDIPSHFMDQRVFIRFNGAKSLLEVSINGQFVGLSKGSMTPHEFEITPYIHEGINRVGAMVVKYSDATYLEDQDMWFLSGIYRDVELFCEPRNYIRDAFAFCEFEADAKTANLHLNVEIEAEEMKSMRLKASLAKDKTIILFDQEINDRIVSITRRIEDVEGWTAETPNLYEIRLELYQDKQFIQGKKFDYGFRQTEIVDGILLINKKPIKLKGVNRHDFHPVKGWAIDKQTRETDIRIMKSHNINAIRTSHYPNDRHLYELCDRYGLYVIDEADLETHGVRTFLPKDDPRWLDAMIDRGIRMVKRDRNHACIVMWSLGNEAGFGTNFITMKKAMKEADATRPFHYEGDPTLKVSDVKSMMYPDPKLLKRYGEKEDILPRTPMDYVMKGMLSKFYHAKKDYENLPVMVCEYAHCMGNSLGNLKEHVELIDAYPNLLGGFIWDFVDQAIEKQDRHGHPIYLYGGDFDEEKTNGPFCANGLIAADRTLHPAISEVKKVYANLSVTKDEENLIIRNKNVFVTTDEYRFILRKFVDGKLDIETELIVPTTPPLSQASIKLPDDYHKKDTEHDILLEVDVLEKFDRLWCSKDHEVTFFQFEERKDRSGHITPSSYQAPDVIDTSTNLEIIAGKMRYVFDKVHGLLEFCSDNEENLFEYPLDYNFSRADIDNDRMLEMWAPILRHFNLNRRWDYNVSMLRAKKFDVVLENHDVLVTIRHKLPDVSSMITTYRFYGNGTVDIKLELTPKKEIMRVGMNLTLSNLFDTVAFYGKGPQENYRDRNTGAKVGIYSGKLFEFIHHYMRPSENGNHTEVRHLSVKSKAKSFVFEALSNDLLNTSVWPYTQSELASARHIHDLPTPRVTTVNIDLGQRGVGGDSPMNGGVLKEYRMKKNVTYTLHYRMHIEK
ncbi:MAG: glycoside hydrolase family 2 TIM barrel-domain containing protein [Erysipelotrichaceae bacterium]